MSMKIFKNWLTDIISQSDVRVDDPGPADAVSEPLDKSH